MTLETAAPHLRHIADVADAKLPSTYFVLQRPNGDWSPAARILSVHDTEAAAEAAAARQKQLRPHQLFGVAALRSEIRQVKKPLEIVRAD